MKRIVTAFATLAMAFAITEPAQAQLTDIEVLPVVVQFKLRVGAVLRRVSTQASDATIRFIGDGKAEATPRGVKIKFDVLDAQGRRGTAEIRVDNPLNYTNRPFFAGRAKCRVRLCHARFEFALRFKGTIRRIGPCGRRLIMTGGFSSVRSSVDGAVFSGRFGGPNV